MELNMKAIYSDQTVSMTEFKVNPQKVVKSAGPKPFAVLNHNEPAFYVITPEVFEAVVDALEDKQIESLLRKRLATMNKAIEVDLADL